MKNKYLHTTIAILLGSIFIFSAIGKILDAKSFIALTEQYGVGFGVYLAPLLPGVEIFLGLMLVMLLYPRIASLLSFIMLFAFTLLFAYAHFVNNVQDCGCFSLLQSFKFPPWLSLLRNILLMGLSLLVWTSNSLNQEMKRYKLVVIATITALAFLCTGYTMHSPILKERDYLTGRNIENTILSRYVQSKQDSTYLFFIYASNCPHCWDVTENVKKFREAHQVDRIVGLTFHVGDSLEKMYVTSFNPNFPIHYLEKEDLKKITNKIPTLIWVKNGVVKLVLKDESISPLRFSYYYKDIFRKE